MSGCYGQEFNDCCNRKNCTYSKLCFNCSQCHLHCKDYSKQQYSLLLQPPYVCNGCNSRSRCRLEKHLYSVKSSHSEYKEVLSESRSGISIAEEEAYYLDSIISPLIQKGQSIHHICSSKLDTIMLSEKTIYNYVDKGIFSARNLGLPRKVRFRIRKSKHDSFKVDKGCRMIVLTKIFFSLLNQILTFLLLN